MADGCADLAGCLDVFSAGSVLNNKDGSPDGCGLMFFFPIIFVAGMIHLVSPAPPPKQPKPPITERIKDVAKRPINRYKIDKAKKAYDKKQAEKSKPKLTWKKRLIKWLEDE